MLVSDTKTSTEIIHYVLNNYFHNSVMKSSFNLAMDLDSAPYVEVVRYLYAITYIKHRGLSQSIIYI